jgi:hypothetical protein
MGAVQSALGMGRCGRDICGLAKCLLQFARAGQVQLGRFLAEQSKFYRLYLHSGRLTLAAM